MSAMNDKEDAWDKLLNPFEHSIEKGRNEGTKAGLESGCKEGYKLGHLTALDIGIEVGYYLGLATKLLESIVTVRDGKNLDDRSYNRLTQRLRELIQLSGDFPDPNTIFESSNWETQQPQNSYSSLPQGETHYAPQQLLNQPPIQDFIDETRAVDITEALEHLRSRFKLLITQLNAPEISLHVLMDDKAQKKGRDLNSPKVVKNDGLLIYDDW